MKLSEASALFPIYEHIFLLNYQWYVDKHMYFLNVKNNECLFNSSNFRNGEVAVFSNRTDAILYNVANTQSVDHAP